jgi:hypothetical protein
MNLPKHSKLGASSATRWMACPGSVALSESVPPESLLPTSVYAAEGTVAHEIAEKRLLKMRHRKRGVVECDGHEVQIIPEMHKGAELYCRAIAENQPGELLVERRVHIEKIHPYLYGTADAILITKNTLFVYDYKFGKTVVDVEDNPQLLFYALGAVLEVDFRGEWVELVVVQPRAGKEPVRRWRFPTVDLLDFSEELRRAAVATEAPDAPLIPDASHGGESGKYCWWCPAGSAGVCPAVNEYKHAKALKKACDEFSPFNVSEVIDE